MTYVHIESQNWILPGSPLKTSDFGLQLVHRFAGLSRWRMLLTGSCSIPRQAVRIVLWRRSQILIEELSIVDGPITIDGLRWLRMRVSLRDGAGSIGPSEAVVGGPEAFVIIGSSEAVARDLRRKGGGRRWGFGSYRAERRAVWFRRSGRRGSPGRRTRRIVRIVDGSTVIHGQEWGSWLEEAVDKKLLLTEGSLAAGGVAEQGRWVRCDACRVKPALRGGGFVATPEGMGCQANAFNLKLRRLLVRMELQMSR